MPHQAHPFGQPGTHEPAKPVQSKPDNIQPTQPLEKPATIVRNTAAVKAEAIAELNRRKNLPAGEVSAHTETPETVEFTETVTAKIKGYRQLSEEEQALMNEAKELEQSAIRLLKKVRKHIQNQILNARSELAKDGRNIEIMRLSDAEPERWLSMARTDFQTATMKLCRAVAQPRSEEE